MASNITISPSSHIHLSDKLVWGGVLTDLGTFPIKKELAVQLVINGQDASDIKRIRPSSTGEVLYFDFTDLVSRFLDTRIDFTNTSRQSISAASLISSPFVAVVSLKYGEASYNTENCAENSITLSEQTNDVNIYNSNVSYGFQYPVDPLNFIFTNRPKCYSLPVDSHDSFFMIGSATVQYKYYDNQNNEISSSPNVVTSPALTVVYVGSGGLPNGTAYYTYSITIGGSTETYRVNIHQKDDSKVVYFQEPLGSYSPMLFDGSEVNYINRTSSKVSTDTYNVIPDLTRDGIKEYNLKHFEEISLTKKTFVMESNKGFYKSFADASRFVIQNGFDRHESDPLAKKQYMKLIVPIERMPFYFKRNIMELQLSGYYATQLETHQYV